MKTKTIYSKLTLVVLIAFFSCKKDYALQMNAQSNQANTMAVNDNNPENGYQYFESMDQNLNMVATRMQLPSDWKRSSDKQYSFVGPNGMKIGGVQGSQQYSYTNNYQMLQTFQMSGRQSVYPMSIDEIVQTFFVPYAQQRNMRLLSTTNLPKVAKKAKLFLDLNYSYLPRNVIVEAAGLEWEDTQGKKYYTILRKLIFESQYQVNWSYLNQHVEAPTAYFNKAKEIFLAGVLSEQHNTEWLFKLNQLEAQKANQSFKAHQARMNAIALNSSNSGFSSSNSTASIYSDILDINHSGYLKRDAMTSHGQSRTVNAINGTNVISNHYSGEHYNVQAGSKYYWVNNNGKYFGTDNANYDPRTDNRINNTQWSQFKIEN